jgi:hypothetical protein
MVRLDLRGFDDRSMASSAAGQVPTAEGGDAASLALMLVEIIRLEYGERLTAADLAGVAEQIRAGLDRADLIRRADQGHQV